MEGSSSRPQTPLLLDRLPQQLQLRALDPFQKVTLLVSSWTQNQGTAAISSSDACG
jgi:hypothetical protein